VALRLPPFWFALAEAQFELEAITSENQVQLRNVTIQPAALAEVTDIVTLPPELEPYDRLKAELVRRLSTSRDKSVRRSSHMSKWTMRNHPSSSGTLRAWHQTILFAPPEPVFYNRTYEPYSHVRLRAVLIQPPTSLTGFARSLPLYHSKHLPFNARQHSWRTELSHQVSSLMAPHLQQLAIQ
jgi:hypothetical protein